MQINRDLFLEAYAKEFGAVGNVQRLNNINTMLSALEKFVVRLNPDRLLEQSAYVCATVHHETNGTYAAYKEKRQVQVDTPRRKEVKRLQDRYWNTGYYGRGPIQLTWRAEYAWAERVTGRPLLNDPDLLLSDLSLGYEVAIKSMTDRSINGKCMNDYINAAKVDYVNCRRVVNILDCAEKIAGYAQKFYTILQASTTC